MSSRPAASGLRIEARYRKIFSKIHVLGIRITSVPEGGRISGVATVYQEMLG